MTLAIKERIIARRQVSRDRFIRATKPVFWVDLSKNDGTQFTSDDATGHLCTVTGALWTPQGRDLDGTDNYITVPRASSIEPAEFTLLIWIKADAIGSSGSVMFSKDQTSHIAPYYSYHFRINNASSTLHFEWNDGTDNQNLDGSILSTGIWTHLAATFKAGSQIVYKDAVSVLSGTRTDTITYYATDLIIGTSLNLGGAYDVDGKIGEVAIYNRALSAQEVSQHRQLTKWRYQ